MTSEEIKAIAQEIKKEEELSIFLKRYLRLNEAVIRYPMSMKKFRDLAYDGDAVLKINQLDLAMFGESMQPDGHEMMYVATTPDKINGAGIIAYPEFMQQAVEQLNGDFYLLPSSRHEVILVKDDGGMNFEQLQDMVREVNATEVKEYQAVYSGFSLQRTYDD